MPIRKLDKSSFEYGLYKLCKRDARLSSVIEQYGAPPFWVRSPGWKTLVKIILEQQVSLASGRAVYQRLVSTVQPFTVQNLSDCSISQLRSAGLTRQKAAYCRGLAGAIAEGTFRLSLIARQQDVPAREALCELKGIGPWTADVYLLMALRRPDVWPPGDIALLRAINDLYGIKSERKMTQLVASWSPWRAVAARILWHDYLQRRGRKI